MGSAPHNPPFRADHVGSFLRPPQLLSARADREAGKISAAELRAIEDDAIRDVVKFQESLGLQSITDGEYRRAVFYMGFYGGLGGVSATYDTSGQEFTFVDRQGHKLPADNSDRRCAAQMEELRFTPPSSSFSARSLRARPR